MEQFTSLRKKFMKKTKLSSFNKMTTILTFNSKQQTMLEIDFCPFSREVTKFELSKQNNCSFFPKGNKEISWIFETPPFECKIFKKYSKCPFYRQKAQEDLIKYKSPVITQ